MGKKVFYFMRLMFIAVVSSSPLCAMRVQYIDLGPTKILHWVETDENGYTDITIQKMERGGVAEYRYEKLRFENKGESSEQILTGQVAQECWDKILGSQNMAFEN
jgi:hypothetical protein